MGEIKRRYRMNEAGERPEAGDRREAPPSWEVRQKGNDFEVVRRPEREGEAKQSDAPRDPS